MSNPFAELEHRLDRVPVNRDAVRRLLEKMAHDLEAAEYNREKAPDWALKMAHEAILSGCTALMAAHGYRAKANGHHYLSLRFAQLALPQHTKLLDHADMLRRRRHQLTYGATFNASEEEVRGSLDLAHQLAPLFKAAAVAALERTNPRHSQ